MTAHRFEEEEFQGQLNLGIWRDLIRKARGHRRYIIALMVLASVLAGVDVSFTLVIGRVIGDLEAGSPRARWIDWVGVYLGLILVFATFVRIFIWLGGKISTGVAHDIRQRAFERLQELSFSFYDRRPVGWLVTRLTSDCDRLSRILAWGVLDIVWGSLFLVLIAITMLLVHWQLGLIVLTVVPPLAIISVVYQRRLLRTSRQVRKTNSTITAAYNEAIMGVRTTKALVRERDNLREFQGLTGRMFSQSVHNAVLSAQYLPLVLALGAAGEGLALWFGGRGVIAEIIELETLYVFFAFAGLFFMPVQELARALAELQAAQAAAERVLGLLDTQPDIQDSPAVRARLEQYADPADRPAGAAIDGHPDRIETIEFANVDFAYNKGQRVLDAFHLRVERGQTIALVGPTGGGKSTIVSLLCRFYEPTGGQVRINGVDYRDRSLHWLQANLGIVLQTPHLFSGTIRENIRYGRLDATDDEVAQAARLVNAHTFIRQMDGGYDAPVGEQGTNLSTGQRQLISFARAVLADPQVFVMDEATSSVDTETEKLIQQGLHRVLAGRISFIIAHRLSTIRSADRILVIRDGRIAESGNHHELIARRGEYYQLYTNQFTAERSEQVLDGLHDSDRDE